MFCPKCSSDKIYKQEGRLSVSGNQRYRCRSCNATTTNPIDKPVQILPKMKKGKIKGSKFFIVTSAVNDTGLVLGALETMKKLADYYNGELLVIPTQYKNPTAFSKGVQVTYTWPTEILPYLCNIDIMLNNSICVKGDTKIQQTAANPLTGFAAAGTQVSEVYGHAQIAMEMVANPSHKMPKMLHTTGSISRRNYGNSVAGKKAHHHHSIGGLIVEIQGDRFWTREINFDGEGVYDLDKYFTISKLTKSPVEAIVYGDTHVDSLPKATEELLDNVSNVLKPTYNIFHDVHNHTRGSHHNRGKTITNLRLAQSNQLCIRDELLMAVSFLRTKHNPHVIDSNHDRHLNQWFDRFKPTGEDLVNLPLYYELSSLLLKSEHDNLFQLFVEQHIDNVTFVDCDDVFDVAGVDCSQHGDRGPNGSRGSARGLSKAGHKMVVGHSHCLTSQHDVLTREGWLPISEVEECSEILSWDPSSDTNIWLKPESKFTGLYSGQLIRINKQGRFDQEVTRNHELMLRDGRKVNVCQAILSEHSVNLPVNARRGQHGDLVVDEMLLRRIVAVCADGSFYKRSLCFHIKKERKIERLKWLFGDDLRDPKTGGNRAFKISLKMDSQSYEQMIKYITPTTEGKCLPSWFCNLTESCKKIVIDELTNWDGTYSTGCKGEQWTTAKKREANIVSTILATMGYRHTMKDRGQTHIVSWCPEVNNNLPSDTHEKDRLQRWSWKTRNVTNEPVYCFTMNTGCFWVRSQRTGLVSLTGNSSGIVKSVYQVGVSNLNHHYAKGLSSWTNSHCIIYKNGKRSLFHIVDGKLSPTMRELLK